MADTRDTAQDRKNGKQFEHKKEKSKNKKKKNHEQIIKEYNKLFKKLARN